MENSMKGTCYMIMAIQIVSISVTVIGIIVTVIGIILSVWEHKKNQKSNHPAKE